MKAFSRKVSRRGPTDSATILNSAEEWKVRDNGRIVLEKTHARTKSKLGYIPERKYFVPAQAWPHSLERKGDEN